MSTDHAPAGATASAMARLLPPDLVDRESCPFAPSPGLAARRGGGPVQRLTLQNGAPVWLVTGFDEAREILADHRFSSDRVRRRDASQLPPTRSPDSPPRTGRAPVPRTTARSGNRARTACSSSWTRPSTPACGAC